MFGTWYWNIRFWGLRDPERWRYLDGLLGNGHEPKERKEMVDDLVERERAHLRRGDGARSTEGGSVRRYDSCAETSACRGGRK